MMGVSSGKIYISTIVTAATVAVTWTLVQWNRNVSRDSTEEEKNPLSSLSSSLDPTQDMNDITNATEVSTAQTCLKSFPPMTEIELDISKNHEDILTLQTPNTISICYASVTGTCTTFAQDLYTTLQNLSTAKSNPCTVQLCTVDQIDWWEELLSPPPSHTSEETLTSVLLPPIVLFILPTWTQGTLPEPYSVLLTSIYDILNDWRVAPQPLRHKESSTSSSSLKDHPFKIKHPSTLRIACFGIGSSAYNSETFCKPAKDVFSSFMKLGAHSLILRHGTISSSSSSGTVVGMGDVEMGNHADRAYQDWKVQVVKHIQQFFDVYTTSSTSESVSDLVIRGVGRSTKIEHHPSVPSSSSSSCCGSKNSSSTTNDCATNKNDSTSCSCKDMSSSSSSTRTTTTATNATKKEEGKYNHDCHSTSPNMLQQEEKHDNENNDDDDNGLDAIYENDEEDDMEEENEAEILDLEDIGDLIQASTRTTRNDGKEMEHEPKEMLTSKQAAALKKEGYRIIGTHSAVKLCRWTKHQLRGRGGCYKHTFYGITSYQCMEATPSLACANKCVFCWRHHKNPVGKEWKWKTDDPYFIVDQAIQLHISMIREAKGIPGVVPERWREAHTVRHCALSLVGEPIMYPRINELLGELHRRCISTFLVTNGQHPHAIETVIPVTQLYVSVDASTPETLEAIDRPLFSDAWDRLCSSLTSLKNRGQRTVARLTVVKGWNSDEIEGYAKLIALGHCSFVEVRMIVLCFFSLLDTTHHSNSFLFIVSTDDG